MNSTSRTVIPFTDEAKSVLNITFVQEGEKIYPAANCSDDDSFICPEGASTLTLKPEKSLAEKGMF